MPLKVIIQGAPRMGTTVMIDLFKHHSRIDNVIVEPPAIIPQLFLKDKSTAVKLPSACFDTFRLKTAFPDAYFILIVRDPRDTFAGYLAYPDNINIILPQYRDNLETGFIKQCMDYLHSVNEVITNNYDKVVVIRLEDLILKQKEVLEAVFDEFLDIGLEKSVSEFAEKHIKNTTVKDYPHTAGSFSLKSPIKVGKWKTELINEEKEEFDNDKYRRIMEVFGYVRADINDK